MKGHSGQTTVEFALAFAAILAPLTFAVIYTSEVLWMWHSVNEFTRQGASYAATHCWQSSASNVIQFMRQNVPPMVNQDQFINGEVPITVSYFAKDSDSGALVPFTCDSDCSPSCIPDTVTVSVVGFQWRTFVSALGVPPIPMPDFQTSMPIESAGCDPEQGSCLP